MAMDNPYFGVGFGKFRQHYMQYNPDPNEKELKGDAIIVAHSSYFQIWAELGTPALVVYFGLIFTSLWTCRRIRKMASTRYFSSWIINYAIMFEASMATFLVGATFLNRGHFDLVYHLVALTSCMVYVARKEVALSPEASSSPEEAPSGIEVRWRSQAGPSPGGGTMLPRAPPSTCSRP